MIISHYRKLYHRYFSDIDIYIDSQKVDIVEKILYEQGYIQGNIVNGKIVKASRKEILYQKLNTHEIYQMVKLNNDNFYTEVDVNFMFAWRGFNRSTNPYYTSENVLKNIRIIQQDDTPIPIFNNELQFIHLCTHFYNEAMFFALDRDYKSGSDPEELLLFRLLDVLLIIKHGVQVKQIYDLALDFDTVNEIEYVLSLISYIMDEDYINQFSDYFDINKEMINVFYSKNGEIIPWPITIEERLFNLDTKKCALAQLADKGYI